MERFSSVLLEYIAFLKWELLWPQGYALFCPSLQKFAKKWSIQCGS